MNEATDADLVRACLGGDTGAFEPLVQRYERAIYGMACRLTNDREEAKDIAQTVFLKAYQNLESYDLDREFHSWLYRIAVNESLNHRKRRRGLEPLDAVPYEGLRDGGNPESECAGREMRDLIAESLMTLQPDHRAVIVLRHFQGCSYQEIGQIVRIPEKTVKSRLFTARQILKDLLRQRSVL